VLARLSFVSLLFYNRCLKFFYLDIGSWFACFLCKYYCLCFFFGKDTVSSLTYYALFYPLSSTYHSFFSLFCCTPSAAHIVLDSLSKSIFCSCSACWIACRKPNCVFPKRGWCCLPLAAFALCLSLVQLLPLPPSVPRPRAGTQWCLSQKRLRRCQSQHRRQAFVFVVCFYRYSSYPFMFMGLFIASLWLVVVYWVQMIKCFRIEVYLLWLSSWYIYSSR
jgi:hypothetical protein